MHTRRKVRVPEKYSVSNMIRLVFCFIDVWMVGRWIQYAMLSQEQGVTFFRGNVGLSQAHNFTCFLTKSNQFLSILNILVRGFIAGLT